MANTYSVVEAAPGQWTVNVEMTTAAVGENVEIQGAPRAFKVTRAACEVLSGPATECNPLLTSTTPAASAEVDAVAVEAVAPADAANPIDVVGSADFLNQTTDGYLYFDPQINAGPSHVKAVFTLRSSW